MKALLRPAVLTAAAVLALACQATTATEEAPESAEAELGESANSASLALFTQDIDAWKAQFAARAAAWKAIEPRSESGRLAIGSGGDGIDYLFVPGATGSRNLVVMNAGIHGVEAPAGVVFEDVFLGNCANKAPFDRAQTALLVIHVMNPYGARNGRRFNASNVDLNRNAFDHTTDEAAAFWGKANPDYEAVRAVVESRMHVGDFLQMGVQHGGGVIERALSGQYSRPQGIYYGGSELQPEVIAVEKLMERFVPLSKNVAFIDVHTGLGKHALGVYTTNSGVNQIMTNPLPAGATPALRDAYARERAELDAMFPPAECAPSTCVVQHGGELGESGHTFLTTGDITQWVHARFAEQRTAGTVLSVTSEIATSSPASVLESIADENYCYWRKETPECATQHAKDVAALRASFNPDSTTWRASVVRAADQMCTALGRFSRLP